MRYDEHGQLIAADGGHFQADGRLTPAEVDAAVARILGEPAVAGPETVQEFERCTDPACQLHNLVPEELDPADAAVGPYPYGLGIPESIAPSSSPQSTPAPLPRQPDLSPAATRTLLMRLGTLCGTLRDMATEYAARANVPDISDWCTGSDVGRGAAYGLCAKWIADYIQKAYDEE